MPRHLATIVATLGLACLVQGVVIARVTVPSADSVRFVATARTIDEQGLLATIRGQWEQPLYPAWLCVVHGVVERFTGAVPAIWAISVHLAAAIPAVLAVVPLYFLTIRVHGAAAAAAGTVLFCVLPEWARLGAYGISDSTHLLWFCLAYWAIVRYFAGPSGQGTMARVQAEDLKPGREEANDEAGRRQPLWLLLAGLAAGLALLTRVEVAVLVPTLLAAMVILQWQPAHRQPWSAVVVAMACFLLGLTAVVGPYLWAAEAWQPQQAIARILGWPAPKSSAVPERATDDSPANSRWELADGRPMAFTLKNPGTTNRRRGLAQAAWQFSGTLAKAFWYWIGLLGLLAIWRVRGTRASPVDCFVNSFLVVYCLVAFVFAAKEGYIAARHLLPLIVAGIGCCGWGAVDLGRALARRIAASPRPSSHARTRWGVAIVTLLAAASCLWQTTRSMNWQATAHRAAAEWLVAQAPPEAAVVDTRAWTGLYSGRRTYLYGTGPAGFADPTLGYVVVERKEVQSDSRRGETLRQLLGQAGRLAASFPAALPQTNEDVLIYHWNSERFWEKHAAIADRR